MSMIIVEAALLTMIVGGIFILSWYSLRGDGTSGR